MSLTERVQIQGVKSEPGPGWETRMLRQETGGELEPAFVSTLSHSVSLVLT